MTEYIDRAQALAELRSGWFPQSTEYTEAVAIAKNIIEGLPAVDAVPVVRCADCAYCADEVYRGRKTGEHICKCEQWQDAEGWDRNVNLDDYCSYGVRRNG